MSIWPFGHRGPAKPKRSTPQPSPSHPGAGEKNPAGGGVSRRLSKASASRRRTSLRSPTTQQPANEKTATSGAPLNALNESSPATAEPPEQEKEKSALAEEAPPLQQPEQASSPMDIDYEGRRRPSTGGSMRAERITALPTSRMVAASPHLRPVTQDTADNSYNWQMRSASHHSLPNQTPQPRRGKLQRNPSRNKRSAQHDSPLARRMSSKKRRKDPAREEEIKAMSRPIDVPKKNADTGILRRESKKARGPLNRNFERPVSTVSLPFEESIHSSMSGEAEPRKYRLSVLDVISPRPAIRQKDMNRTYTNDTASSNLIRKASRSDRPSGRPVQTWRPTKEEKAARERARIDSLADDMDSTELRDILERDRKRKLRKQERDAERLQRKLERRAEKQRTKEWLAQQQAEGGAETEKRPAVPAPAETVAQKDQDAHMTDEPDFQMDDVNAQNPFVDAKEQQPNPFQDPERTPSLPTAVVLDIHPALRTPKQQRQVSDALGESTATPIPQMPWMGSNDEDDARQDLATPASDIRTPVETPALDTAQAVSYTAARPATPLSPVTSTLYHGDRAKASKILGADVAQGNYSVTNTVLDDATRPKEVTAPVAVPARAEPAKKDVETPLSASKKRSGFLASLFRSHRKSVSESPRDIAASETSFSNTSREAMSRDIPAHLMHQPSSVSSFKKAGPPLRTHSIFREDLPESPMSPPDSRVQSPVEGSLLGSRYTPRQNRIPSAILSEGSGRLNSPTDDERPNSPLSNKASQIMAHSLASVDSEASWLSGGRHRSHSGAYKHASGSFGRREEFNRSFEELGMPDDEYFRRLNTSPRSEPRTSGLTAAIAGSQHASSTALRSPTLPPQAEEPSEIPIQGEGQLISHAGASRQPTVVHRVDTRHKSSEGLLNTFNSQGSNTLLNKQVAREDEDRTPEAEYPTPADTPTEDRSSSEEVMTPVRRATSVNLGKGHARNMSAGSAKLLDIPRRSSRGDVMDISGFGTPNPPATPIRSSTQLATAEEKKED